MRTTSTLALLLLLSLLAGCPSGAGDAPAFTAVNAGSHEPFFPIKEGHHGGIDCQACHGKVDSFREFRCVDCHEHEQIETDRNHLGLPGYEYESRACYDCHPRGDANSSAGNHELVFPISADSEHRDVSCSGCHLSTEDRTQLACATCHEPAETSADHGLVSDFEQESRRCVRCHADSQVDTIVGHVPFKIDPGAPHGGAECPECACLTCHPALRADKPFGADFRVPECLTCHLEPETSTSHAGVGDFEYTSGACVLCHPDGEGALNVDHSGYFPIGAGSDHASASCSECHANATDHTDVDCLTCHPAAETTPDHLGVGGFAQRSGSCLRCHADSQVDRLSDHLPFRVTGRHTECIRCHEEVRPDRPYPAADFAPYNCLGSGCHDNRAHLADEHDDEAGYAYVSTTCTDSGCHPDGRKHD